LHLSLRKVQELRKLTGIKFDMKVFIFLSSLMVAAAAAWAGGDSIEMRDGTTISGDIIAQGNVTSIPGRTGSVSIDAVEVWIATKDGLKKIPTSEIKTIHFGPKLQPATETATDLSEKVS
jgi:hypothetical protein